MTVAVVMYVGNKPAISGEEQNQPLSASYVQWMEDLMRNGTIPAGTANHSVVFSVAMSRCDAFTNDIAAYLDLFVEDSELGIESQPTLVLVGADSAYVHRVASVTDLDIQIAPVILSEELLDDHPASHSHYLHVIDNRDSKIVGTLALKNGSLYTIDQRISLLRDLGRVQGTEQQ